MIFYRNQWLICIIAWQWFGKFLVFIPDKSTFIWSYVYLPKSIFVCSKRPQKIFSNFLIYLDFRLRWSEPKKIDHVIYNVHSTWVHIGEKQLSRKMNQVKGCGQQPTSTREGKKNHFWHPKGGKVNYTL